MFKNAELVRVLVVDDESMIADTLVTILNMNGFQTSAAYSGKQAVEAAATLKPHILIMDVIMAGMNGIEAAICICKRAPDCKVILFSGQPGAVDLLDRAHADGHRFELLAKPLHPQVIMDHLNAAGRTMAQFRQ